MEFDVILRLVNGRLIGDGNPVKTLLEHIPAVDELVTASNRQVYRVVKQEFVKDTNRVFLLCEKAEASE